MKKKIQSESKYTPVSDNVYHDGSSYRVRVCINGLKYSKNFPNKRQTIKYRNHLWNLTN